MEGIEHSVVVDFETYYDTDYSLAKMPMWAYINDPLFEIIGVSYKVDEEKTLWVPGTSLAALGAWLHAAVDWDKSIFVAHNAMFDAAIMACIFGIRPKRYFCTQMAARPMLAPKIGSVSLANISEYLGIGRKGTEVYDAKGKRLEDFTKDELDVYGEYCKNDVTLTWYIYKILNAWYDQNERT